MNDLYQRICEQCEGALASVRERVSPKLYDDVAEYIHVGEWGIAMEVLVSELCEDEIKISLKSFEEIFHAMELMNLTEFKGLAYLRERCVFA